MQATFLERWCEFHGPLPEALVAWLMEFGLQAPNARAKMAVWLLWLDACCESPYWKQALAALPQEADMPNVSGPRCGERWVWGGVCTGMRSGWKGCGRPCQAGGGVLGVCVGGGMPSVRACDAWAG